MGQSTIRRGRYAYVHDVNGSPPETIDVHHILVSNTWISFSPSSAAESVIILAAFGVQLETMFGSGRTVRHFVPISKILKPVLVECITPFSCYWSLSLIVRGEEELLPVLKGLYPPVKMLVPIWKALSVAIANGECNPTLDDSRSLPFHLFLMEKVTVKLCRVKTS
ncbi:uncharacterized protein LOC142530697 [Primulina tabacum]|uniref:uncharacterized protein LOC142530697 n=1 Tax=Primulina tabacum TaxID=48773 RepID=UPI003F5947AD